MKKIHEIEKRRQLIAEELLRIRTMRPGNINEQVVRAIKDGKAVLRGPYPVLCWREGKKVFSERLTTKQARQWAQEDIANYKHFNELCKEFEGLTRQLGTL